MSTFSRGLASQLEVIWALMLRETRTRFGLHSFGYLWALAEPLMMIITFWAMFMFVDRRAPTGMDQYTFLTTGMVPYMVFVGSANMVAESINGNKNLLYYPHVKPIDLVYARAMLELATHVAVFIVLMGGHALYHQQLDIDDALLTVLGLVLAGALGASLGMVLCMAGQYSRFLDRVRNFFFRPMFWVSGIFFTVHELPEEMRNVVLLNPVVHCVELTRAGWFASYDARYVNAAVPLGCILVLAFIGLSLERRVRRRIEVAS